MLLADLWQSNINDRLTFMLSTEIDSHSLYAPLADNTVLDRKTRHAADAR
ncbi:MAG: hypothetical protein CG441_1269 [Methylococcaceae bacterium NSM2-1]|jgi:hypothetical protein|nr:MAG: hypothetical protein CG441_1269 [Methylococcaceae bacterium NSM2-1]